MEVLNCPMMMIFLCYLEVKASVPKSQKKKKSRIDEDVAELLYTPKISSSARSIVESKKFQTFHTCEKEVFEVDPFEFDHSIFAQPLENNLSGDSIASTSVTVERCAIRIENLLDEKHSVILHLRMDATIRELATEYGKRFNMPIERMLLMDKEGRRCTLEKTPKSLGFKLDLLNVLELLETPSSSELADVISIKWQMNGKKPIITKANIKTPFSVLKEKLCKDNNIPSEVRLIFDSMAIRDDETPESLEMEHGDCIDIYQN